MEFNLEIDIGGFGWVFWGVIPKRIWVGREEFEGEIECIQ